MGRPIRLNCLVSGTFNWTMMKTRRYWESPGTLMWAAGRLLTTELRTLKAGATVLVYVLRKGCLTFQLAALVPPGFCHILIS